MTIETLDEWLQQEGIVPAEGPGAIADVAWVRGLLIAAARRGEAVSYSELLGQLGFRFTRPKMRAVCRTLDAIDTKAAADGEPALAALVVRESDRLPGQGWWTGATAAGYQGGWTGREATEHVRGLQQTAFDYWATRAAWTDRPRTWAGGGKQRWDSRSAGRALPRRSLCRIAR